MRIQNLLLLALPLIQACSEQAATTTASTIPTVTLTCSSSSTYCATDTSAHNAFVFITSSGCQSFAYGEVATGTGTVTCSGGTCTGQISNWANAQGSKATQIGNAVYDVCAVIDIKNNWAGTPVAGDVTGAALATSFSSSVTAVSITSWKNDSF